MIELADSGKVIDSIIVSEIFVGSIEPFPFFHFFKRIGVLIGIVLNNRLQLP